MPAADVRPEAVRVITLAGHGPPSMRTIQITGWPPSLDRYVAVIRNPVIDPSHRTARSLVEGSRWNAGVQPLDQALEQRHFLRQRASADPGDADPGPPDEKASRTSISPATSSRRWSASVERMRSSTPSPTN